MFQYVLSGQIVFDAGSSSLSDSLATLNFICQSVSHCARLFMSFCKIWQSIGGSYIPVQNTIVIKEEKDDLILSGRSLIKMRNRISPKTDFWATPDRA